MNLIYTVQQGPGCAIIFYIIYIIYINIYIYICIYINIYIIYTYGGFRFGPDMSTSELLPFKMASEKTIEEPGV
jgi:hypothetical protein